MVWQLIIHPYTPTVDGDDGWGWWMGPGGGSKQKMVGAQIFYMAFTLSIQSSFSLVKYEVSAKSIGPPSAAHQHSTSIDNTPPDT